MAYGSSLAQAYVLASTKTADMATQASLNYLAPLPQWDDIKPYEISGRVAPGQQKNNLEFVPQVVEVHDARDWGDKFALDTTGFEWVSHNTTEGLDTDASVTRYVEELEAFLGKYLEADMVLTFQYQVCALGKGSILETCRARSRISLTFLPLDPEAEFGYPRPSGATPKQLRPRW